MFSDEFSDIVFTIGQVKIPAHKAVLVSKSEYFATMFKNAWKESKNNIVKMDHVNLEVFKSVLKYIYTGDIEASTEKVALEMFELSQQYLLNDLKALIENEIKVKMTIVNVFSIMKMAHDMKLESICGVCYSFLNTNFSKVLEDANKANGMIYEAWKFILKNRVWNKNGQSFGYHYYSSTATNEMKVFNKLLDWAKIHYADMKNKQVQYLFSQIQLNLIASKDIVGTIRRSNVYELDFLFDIIEKKIVNGMYENY